jgi:prepilin-type N-terminal cleavage/methylation domain-containing protein/prepilin-type processing-associated H-X9-DG protein
MDRRAFTLIELLVVVAIVALLISLLLPSLAGARESGRAVVCQAHVRGVVTAMAVYMGEHKEWMPGPNTSGSDLQQNRPYIPGPGTPSQDWDFVSPLLGDSMNYPIDQLQKFQEICMTKLRCPSNRERYSMRFSGSPLPMEAQGEFPLTLSYLTPAYFQMYPTGVTTVGGRTVESVPAGEPIAVRPGYLPRADQIGQDPSKKAFLFEGARYWNAAIKGFDYTTNTNGTGLVGTPQGNFVSRGPAFFGSGENYLREPSRGYKPSDILKRISLRHAEKMNAGMFDGHVQVMDNVQSADPTPFVPGRSRLVSPQQTWHYYIGPANSPLRTPNTIIN